MAAQLLKLFNPDVLNDIYRQLSLQLEISSEECLDLPDFSESSDTQNPKTVEIFTRAGTFSLGENLAYEMINRFVALDRFDQNGLDGIITLQSVRNFSGVDFSFSDFHPSQLWKDNREIFIPLIQGGNVVDTIGVAKPKILRMASDLWTATTIATLSGLSPDLIEFGSSFCNPIDHCIQSYGLTDKDGASWRSGFVVDETQQEHINVVWNLSSQDVSQKAIRYLAAHEQAHIVYSKIAKYGGMETMFGEIIRWAKNKSKTKEIWAEFKKLSTTEKFQVDYYTHESLDPFFLEKIDPQNREVLKEKWIMMQATALENKIPPANIQTEDVLELAYGVALGRHLDVDPDLLEDYLSYARQVCGTKYGQRFEIFLTWMEYVGDYGRSKEFDAAFEHYLPSTLNKMQPSSSGGCH